MMDEPLDGPTGGARALLWEAKKHLEKYEGLLLDSRHRGLSDSEKREAIAEALHHGARAVNELGASLREASRLIIP